MTILRRLAGVLLLSGLVGVMVTIFGNQQFAEPWWVVILLNTGVGFIIMAGLALTAWIALKAMSLIFD